MESKGLHPAVYGTSPWNIGISPMNGGELGVWKWRVTPEKNHEKRESYDDLWWQQAL